MTLYKSRIVKELFLVVCIWGFLILLITLEVKNTVNFLDDRFNNLGTVCIKSDPQAIYAPISYPTEDVSIDLMESIKTASGLDKSRMPLEVKLTKFIRFLNFRNSKNIGLTSKITDRIFERYMFDDNQYSIINFKNRFHLISFLDRIYKTDKLYEIYLTVSDYNEEFCGIRHTSSAYFRDYPIELNLPQSVILVTLIEDIQFQNDGEPEPTHREKINMVLDEMLLEGYIDTTKYDETQKEVDRLFAEGLPKRTSEEVF